MKWWPFLPILAKMMKVLFTGWWRKCGLNWLNRFFGGGESGLNWKQSGAFEDFSVGNTDSYLCLSFLNKNSFALVRLSVQNTN